VLSGELEATQDSGSRELNWIPQMELFEKVVELGGKILSVERTSPAAGPGGDEEMCASAILLTFDVARILVTARPGRSRELRQVASAEEAGVALSSASEDDPWWRVLGSPLVRSTDEEAEGGGLRALRLQFRGEDDSPRFIFLRLAGGLVRAGLEQS
jgi:hypothetical protein